MFPANIGGILGLCLGFPILSGVEVLYFFTLRAFWKICRKRTFNSKAKNLQQKKRSKVITINSNTIPVYPSNLEGESMWTPSSKVKVRQVTDNSLGKKLDHML